jgi:hypothetical protein
MAQRNPGASFGRNENVLTFARASASDCGTTALNLVYLAAEGFSSMEEHAREIEARAQSLCKDAAERLKFAEKRIEAAEHARREIITEADCKTAGRVQGFKSRPNRASKPPKIS